MIRNSPLWLLLVVQAIVSAASLVVEIVAGRMLAPYVGMSLYTWTSVIAVVLAGFSVGHWWGGLLAERAHRPALRATGWAMLAAALSTAIAIVLLQRIAGPVLQAVGHPVWGIAVLATLVFFLPSCFAGIPAPVLARIAVEGPGRSGRALGAIFAVGAVGAILGTLLAGFLFISWLGTAATLAVVTLAYVGAVFLWLGAVQSCCRFWPGQLPCCWPGCRWRHLIPAPAKAGISAFAVWICRKPRTNRSV
jgi:MFS family permease